MQMRPTQRTPESIIEGKPFLGRVLKYDRIDRCQVNKRYTMIGLNGFLILINLHNKKLIRYASVCLNEKPYT